MKIVRRTGVALAALVVGLGIVGTAAPAAHADTSWGYKSIQPLDTSWGYK